MMSDDEVRRMVAEMAAPHRHYLKSHLRHVVNEARRDLGLPTVEQQRAETIRKNMSAIGSALSSFAASLFPAAQSMARQILEFEQERERERQRIMEHLRATAFSPAAILGRASIVTPRKNGLSG